MMKIVECVIHYTCATAEPQADTSYQCYNININIGSECIFYHDLFERDTLLTITDVIHNETNNIIWIGTDQFENIYSIKQTNKISEVNIATKLMENSYNCPYIIPIYYTSNDILQNNKLIIMPYINSKDLTNIIKHTALYREWVLSQTTPIHAFFDLMYQMHLAIHSLKSLYSDKILVYMDWKLSNILLQNLYSNHFLLSSFGMSQFTNAYDFSMKGDIMSISPLFTHDITLVKQNPDISEMFGLMTIGVKLACFICSNWKETQIYYGQYYFECMNLCDIDSYNRIIIDNETDIIRIKHQQLNDVFWNQKLKHHNPLTTFVKKIWHDKNVQLMRNNADSDEYTWDEFRQDLDMVSVNYNYDAEYTLRH